MSGPRVNAEQARQPEKHNGKKQAIVALLAAQRRFKHEMEEHWRQVEEASARLELELDSMQNVPTCSTAVPAVSEANECTSSGSDNICRGRSSESNISNIRHDNSPLSDQALHKLMLSKAFRSSSTVQQIEEQNEALERAELEERAREAASQKKGRWWQRWLKSSQFDLLVGFFIIMNMLLIMARIQHDGMLCEPGVDKVPSVMVNTAVHVLEHFFTTFFLVELILRLLANGFGYLMSISNSLDMLIVLGSCIDSWLLPAVVHGAQATNMQLLRIFRLLRLIKVLRIMRVFKVFAPLRVLVQAVMSSMSALAWSLTLLFMLEILGAILLAQSLSSIIQDETRELQLREKLWNAFGTMARSWLTVFEITMAPGGFLQHRYIFSEVHPAYMFLIAAYVCFVTFAVIRVITALFLKATLSASDREARQEKVLMKRQRLEYANRLCSSLQEARGESEGEAARIDSNGLARLLTYERFVHWVEDAGLSIKDTTRLFKVLDIGDGFVDLKEFLASISEICDSTMDRDTILHHESSEILDAVMEIRKVLMDRQGKGFHTI